MRTGPRVPHVLSFAVGVALLTGSLVAQAPAPVDPKFTEALQQGETALKARKWEDALSAFKQANNILDKKSPAALYGVARAYRGLGAFKSEAETCAEALKYVGADKRFEAILRNQRGMALFSQADKNTDKAIKDAEVEFRAAIALPQAPPITHYNLGVSLLKQGRDEEGIAALKTYAESGLTSPEVDLARRMMANPRRGRENYSPDFSLTSARGEFYSLKELEGKTVLIDFWGQWCGPCREVTPDLVRLYNKYKDNPNFVMIGVSSDSRADEQKWKDYVDKNKMLWPQLLDLRRQVIAAFRITSYPTYVVLDAEGIIKHMSPGTGRSGVSVVEGFVKQSLKASEKKLVN